MPFSGAQKFFWSRIAILVAGGAFLVSFLAGGSGFPLWYGPAALFFWILLGLLNLPQSTSVRFLLRHPIRFFVLYAALAAGSALAVQFALQLNFWFYPAHRGFASLFVLFVFLPFWGLVALEMCYLLAHIGGDRLSFVTREASRSRRAIDAGEGIFFLLMWGALSAGAAGYEGFLSVLPYLAAAWFLFGALLVADRAQSGRHLALILGVGAVFAVLGSAAPNLLVSQWTYPDASAIAMSVLGVPLWAIVLWYWFMFFVLRLWIFLAPHEKRG